MGVGNVGGTTGCEQSPGVGGIDTIEEDDIRLRLADQPGEAGLPFRSADRLSQGTCRDGDSGTGLSRAGEQYDHLPVVAIESDEPTASKVIPAVMLLAACHVSRCQGSGRPTLARLR